MFFALREIRRSPGRFVLLAGAVGLLVLLLLFFQAVAGALVTSLTGAFEQQSAPVLVYDDRARLNPNASVLPPDTVAAVEEVEGVTAAAGVSLTVLTGTIGGEQADLALWGVATGGPGWPATVDEGRLPAAAGGAGGDRIEAVVGASSFDTPPAVGDVVTIGEDENAVEVAIVGTAADAAVNVLPTLYLTDAGFDRALAAGRGADAAQAEAEAGGGQAAMPVSLVAVDAAAGVDPSVVADRISDRVAGVEAVDRATAVAALPGVSTIQQSFGILYVLLYIVVTIVTGVFFLILTVQKREAIVLLRALGARRRDVVHPLLLQVGAVTAAGVIGGTAAAAGLLSLSRQTFGAGLDVPTTAASAAAILLLALLASGAAVRRVNRVDPFQATAAEGLT